ncbi:MAG: hypothetical protein AAGE84_13795 [Cyanobacteria bacterium P01_G01_bin.39]
MLIVSSVCYGVVALISVVFGVIYLTRDQFMPYHSLALAKPWTEVEPNIQTLILALMRVAGGGFLATGIAMIVLLLIPFQAKEPWAIYSIFIIALITALGSAYGTFLVKSRTPGNPPFKLSLVSVILSATAFICSLV